MNKTFLRALAMAWTVLGASAAHAELQGRDLGGSADFDAYYDTELNITWLANANMGGLMNWHESGTWAYTLDVHGVTGWRLPKLLQQVGEPGVPGSLVASEMEHLARQTLGIDYTGAGFAGSDTRPFANLMPAFYWTADVHDRDPEALAWGFDFLTGSHQTGLLGFPHGTGYALAVHDGDVGRVVVPPPVPEPATAALTLGGLLLLGGAARRKRH